MKKLSESLWSDMQRRAEGSDKRIEDDIDLLKLKDFCNYLNSIYRKKTISGIEMTLNDLIIPVLVKEHRYTFLRVAEGDEDELIVTFASGENYDEIYPIINKLDEKFSISSISSSGNSFMKNWKICPKNNEEKPTNSFIIEVIDCILENTPDYFEKNIRKIKRLSESLWSDMQRRAEGSDKRIEDDIELLDRDGMVEYIKKHYESINSSVGVDVGKTIFREHGDEYLIVKPFMYISSLYWLYAYFKNDKIYNVQLMAEKKVCGEFLDKLKEKFMVVHHAASDYFTFCTPEGTVTNQLFIDVFDTILENAKRPMYKKREH